MEQTVETIAVERELEIAASPETIWELLVDPEKVTTWMGSAARFDARPGGRLELDVVSGRTATGEFVEVDRPNRLVYTFGWEPGPDGPNALPPGASTVEIDLIPNGAGTLLRFVHRDLPDAASAEAHTEGWVHYLDRLAILAAGGDPGHDPWLDRKM